MSNTQQRISSIDSLRGLAIVMVSAIHCSQSFTSKLGVTNLLTPYGSLGVQLFFIISGFTMLLTFGGNFNSSTVKSFYIRRVARIAPLFWVATLSYLWLDGMGARFWAPHGIDWTLITLTLSFLNGFTPDAINAIVPGGWSIVVEMQFYLIFPVFAFLFIERKKYTIAPYLLITAIYLFGLLISRIYSSNELNLLFEIKDRSLTTAFFYFWLPNQLLCFGFGFLLYEKLEKNNLNIFGAALLICTALLTSLGLSILFLFLLSYFVVSNHISINLFRKIGLASYAMYLMQFAIIQFVSWAGMSVIGRPPSFEFAFIAVVFISYLLSHYLFGPLIEKPSIHIGKLLANKFTLIKTNLPQA